MKAVHTDAFMPMLMLKAAPLYVSPAVALASTAGAPRSTYHHGAASLFVRLHTAERGCVP